MRYRRLVRSVWWALCLCLLCGFAWAKAPKTFKELFAVLQAGPPSKQHYAARSLSLLPTSQLPKSILPYLEQRLLSTKTPQVVRNYICDIIAKMGPKAASSLPSLQLVVLQDPTLLVKMAAINAMSKMGPKAVPALVNMVKSKEDAVRVWAAGALSKMGPTARIAVPALMPMLKHKHWNMRWSAILALSKIGHFPPSLRRSLLPELESKHRLLRVNVCRIFAQMKWPGALPVLLRISRHPDWLTRVDSTKAIGSTGVMTPAVRKAVLRAFKDRHPRVRSAGLFAWALLEGKSESSLKLMMPLRTDANPGVRVSWIRAFSQFSVPEKVAERYLLDALKDKQWPVRKQAAVSLGERKVLSKIAMATMVRQFRGENGFVMQGLMLAFQRQGPRAATAVPTLIEHFRRRNRLLRSWLTKTLVRIGAPALPLLQAGLRSDIWLICEGAAKTLVAFGPSALPALRASLKAKSYKQRKWAAYALGKLGARARPALPALQLAMKDKHPLVRNFVRFAIKKIKRADKRSLSP